MKSRWLQVLVAHALTHIWITIDDYLAPTVKKLSTYQEVQVPHHPQLVPALPLREPFSPRSVDDVLHTDLQQALAIFCDRLPSLLITSLPTVSPTIIFHLVEI